MNFNNLRQTLTKLGFLGLIATVVQTTIYPTDLTNPSIYLFLSYGIFIGFLISGSLKRTHLDQITFNQVFGDAQMDDVVKIVLIVFLSVIFGILSFLEVFIEGYSVPGVWTAIMPGIAAYLGVDLWQKNKERQDD